MFRLWADALRHVHTRRLLQRVIYRVGEAIRRSVPTERLYILSLGSQQSDRHVHWHLVPLPPGVPFEQQQYAVLGRKDYLRFSDDETAQLVDRIRNELKNSRVNRLGRKAWTSDSTFVSRRHDPLLAG